MPGIRLDAELARTILFPSRLISNGYEPLFAVCCGLELDFVTSELVPVPTSYRNTSVLI